MNKKTLMIALAYVGVLTGAGLSSGREIVQYFVSFGYSGLVGVGVVGLLHAFVGKIVLSFGAHYRASEHSEVLDEITKPIISKILDYVLIITCFVIGFVMIAGAGANLQQQFGLPTWVGALICSLLVIVISMLDFEKVTKVIGAFTPLIVVFLFFGAIYTFIKGGYDFSRSNELAMHMESSLPNIWVSVINYFAMCMMTGVSMAFVLGGELLDYKMAGKGGFYGGMLVGLIGFVIAMTLFVKIDSVALADLPMQQLMQDIHPILGLLMALVIFGMIFNTAISLYYSLAKRFSNNDDAKLKKIIVILVAIGFGLSFAGFKTLVAIMYPLLGYIGILLVFVLLYGWFTGKKDIKKERRRRKKIFKLFRKKYNDDEDFTKADQKKLNQLIDDSNIENEELKSDFKKIVKEENEIN